MPDSGAIRSQRLIWAAPGSSHDRTIGVLRVVLPILIGVLAAFVGNEVRGVAGASPIAIPFPPHAGKRAFDMMIYGGAPGEEITFKFWDGIRTLALAEQLLFEADSMLGTAQAPVQLGVVPVSRS